MNLHTHTIPAFEDLTFESRKFKTPKNHTYILTINKLDNGKANYEVYDHDAGLIEDPTPLYEFRTYIDFLYWALNH